MKNLNCNVFLVLLMLFGCFVGVEISAEEFPIENCLSDEIDLLFMEDTSELPNNLVKKDWIDKYLSMIEVFLNDDPEQDMDRVHVAFATFSNNVSLHFDFSQQHSGIRLAAQNIGEVMHMALTGEANTGEALRFILEEAFSPRMGSRSSAQHIAVLLVHNWPSVDLELARKMTTRLMSRSDIQVILFHSIEDIEAGQQYFPMGMAFKVPSIVSFGDSYVRQMCRQCMPGWFGTPRGQGISCYKMMKVTNPPFTYFSSVSTCKSWKDSRVVQVETEDELHYLEKVIYDMSLNEYISFHVGLHRKFDTIAERFGWRNGRPQSYQHWRTMLGTIKSTFPCTTWTLPSIRAVRANHDELLFQNSRQLENQTEDGIESTTPLPTTTTTTTTSTTTPKPSHFERWRKDDYNGFTNWVCHIDTKWILCEEYVDVVSKQGPRVVEASVPSQDSVNEALSKGHYVYVQSSDQGDLADPSFDGYSKVMALSSILFEYLASKDEITLQLSVTEDHPQVLTRESLQQVPLFDCQAPFAEEYLPYSRVCDRVTDCSTGRDELICGQNGYRRCLRTERACTSGQCIPDEAWCDRYPDCLDKSDEDSCDGTCKHYLCVRSADCIPQSWYRDGYDDCIANSGMQRSFDETWGGNTRGSCVTQCNRTECVTREMVMDNFTQCTGPEGEWDRMLGKLEATYCYSQDPSKEITNLEKTWAPRCVYMRDRFEVTVGCMDSGHLRNCENFTCPEGYYKCLQSYCVPLYYLRNQIEDCPHGDDENIPQVLENSNFQCLSREEIPPILLHPSFVCDGNTHCPFWDDETDCDVLCREGFTCVGGATVVTDGYNKNEILSDVSFIDPRTKYLDISGVPVVNFFRETSHQQFLNLLWLNMSNCRLENVDMHLDGSEILKNETFGNPQDSAPAESYNVKNFQTVMTLDLSYNRLKALDDVSYPAFSALRIMTNLQHLNLSHNSDLIVSTTTFQDIAQHIMTLDLSYTEISEISKSMMDLFTSLGVLSLEGTLVSQIKPVFPNTLQYLNLQSIPLESIEVDSFDGLTRIQSLQASSYKVCCSQVRGTSVPEYACFAKDDAISSCDDLIQEPVLRVLLWVFGSAAVTGNIIVVIYRLTLDRAALRRGYGIFVMNLSLSDLLMGIYLMLIASADLKYQGMYVWYERTWREGWMCQLAGFLSTWSSESSAFFIFLITLDRYLVIRFPFGQIRISPAGFIVSSIIAWVSGFFLAALPLLPPFNHWSIYSSNGMCLGLPLTTDRAVGWQYSTSVFVGVNFVMFIVIAIGQIAIYRTMSSSRIANDEGISKFQDTRRLQDIAVAKQLSLVVISDFLCWFPIGTMGLMALAGNDLGNEVYAWTAVLVMPINSAINPILYTVPAVKKTLDSLINRIWDKRSGSAPKDQANKNLSKRSTSYKSQLESLRLTLHAARDFIANTKLGSDQAKTLQDQVDVLNSALDQVKEALSIKMNKP